MRGERDRFLIDLADADLTVVVASGRVSVSVIVSRVAAEALRDALIGKLEMPGGRV